MYRVLLPAESLRPYIECYWTFRAAPGTSAQLREHIVVDGRADVMFNFGCGYQRARLHRAQGSDTLRVSHIDAQRTYPVVIEQSGAIHLVGARFRPGGLAAFCLVPMHELSGRLLDLAQLFGPEAHDLEGRLFDAAERPRAQAALLDAFFLKRLAPPRAHAAALACARQIERDPAQHIAALSTQFGYSIRTVDRLFQQKFGFGPKFYARMTRFCYALTALVQDPQRDWPDLLLQGGYCDQPQLIKAFHDFAGVTPEQYRAVLLARQTPYAPNLVQLLQEH